MIELFIREQASRSCPQLGWEIESRESTNQGATQAFIDLYIFPRAFKNAEDSEQTMSVHIHDTRTHRHIQRHLRHAERIDEEPDQSKLQVDI